MMTPPGPPTQCSITLKDVPTERLLFESFPTSLSEGYNTKWDTLNAGAATADFRGKYGGGNFDPFSLSLEFVAGLHPKVNRRAGLGVEFVLKESSYGRETRIADDRYLDQELVMLERKVRWLQALGLPRPTRQRPAGGRGVVEGEPPEVLITIGRFMTISGIVTSTNTSWKPPFHPVSARPYTAEVSLTIKRLFTFFPDWYDVAEQTVPTVVPFDPIASQRAAKAGVSQTENWNQQSYEGLSQSQVVQLMADDMEKVLVWSPRT
jgi:hypothetical protein